MDSVNATKDFLQILDSSINESMEKAAEKKGITVQELIAVFQESGWQKDTDNNQMKLETIQKRHDRVPNVSENKVNKPISVSISN